jgi:2-phosphosulfolactate phosphatase
LPTLTGSDELRDATAIVIDLLRASTTICHALAAGARQVIPCLEVEDARRIAAGLAPSIAVLGGERDGVRIDGFDLGNSPDEYRPETVDGRTVVFTTTNGTAALAQCRSARRVLIGSFVNFSAICGQLETDQQNHLICAGTRSKITREDVLCCGAIADRLVSLGAVGESNLNDQARIARDAWLQAMYGTDVKNPGSNEALAQTMRETQGGRNLIGLGLDRDIVAAVQIDRLRVVPELNVETWRIVAALP